MYRFDGPEDAKVPILEDVECWYAGKTGQTDCAPIFLNSRFYRNAVYILPLPGLGSAKCAEIQG